MSIPAGWYDDGSGRQRWWDGAQWTEHIAPAEASPVAEAPRIAEEPGVSIAQLPAEQMTPPVSTPPVTTPPVSTPPVADVAAVTVPDAVAAPFIPPYELPGPGVPSVPVAEQPAGYPGYVGSAPPYPQAPAPTKEGMSALGLIGLIVAVIGIVLSCIPPVAAGGWALLGLGFVLSIVSLFLRGAKWPGFLGVGASGLGAILAIAVALISFSGSNGPVAEESARPSDSSSTEPTPVAPEDIDGAVMTGLLDLAVGDCIPLIEYDDLVFEVPVVPCDQPHTDEVYFIFDAAEPEFPGDEALQTEASTRCETEFEAFVGTTYEESELEYYYYVPTKRTWTLDQDRAIQCILFSYDDVTDTMAGSGR